MTGEELLRERGIRVTEQRLAVAEVVFGHEGHPGAEEIWNHLKGQVPSLSRATVYNTLNLFVEKGLLQPRVLREGHIVYDANTDAHHHLIDEESGEIIDIPWSEIQVKLGDVADRFDIQEYHVVIRARRRSE